MIEDGREGGTVVKTPSRPQVTIMNTLEQFAEWLKATVRDVTRVFTMPDDDYLPVLFGLTHDRVTVVEIDPVLLSSEDGKDSLAFGILPYELRRIQATGFGLVMSATIRSNSMPDDLREVVTVHIGSKDKSYIYVAPILRSELTPPTIGEWETLASGETWGRFVDPLREALT